MRKLYLNAIILTLLILAPLTYAATTLATPNNTSTTTTKTPATTHTEETKFTTKQYYPYGPWYSPVYYMDWDWNHATQPEYGYVSNAFGYKGKVIVKTSNVIMQLGGWVRGIPGSDVYTFVPTQDEYYFIAGSTLYVYDLETGETLYKATVGSANFYAVGDYYAGDGLTDVVGYATGTDYLYVWTTTGAYVTSVDLKTLTGADDVYLIYYFGGDYYSKYAGDEVLLYLTYDLGGGKYNASIAVLSLENATAPAIVDEHQIASNVDSPNGGGLLADVNGDGVNELWVYYENESKIWADTYNVTEGTFNKISEFSVPTSYYATTPIAMWVNGKMLMSFLNGTHMYLANLTSGDYWEVAIPENYTENTNYWFAVPGYANDTLMAVIFADKTLSATNDTGLLKLYALNVTNGEEIWNITLGSGLYFTSSWYMATVGGTVYVFNNEGPYFEIDLTSGAHNLKYIPVASSIGSYYLYYVGDDYYVGFARHQVLSFKKDGSVINYGFSEYPLRYDGYYGQYPPPVDMDGDGSPELLVVADAEGGYTNDTYYWLDLDTLQLDEMFGEPFLRNTLLVANILAVDVEGKLALIYAMNYTTSPSTKYFGWFNWSSSEWVNYYTNFYLGDVEYLSSDIAVLVYYNKTAGKTYLAKMNMTSLEVLSSVELTDYPNTYSDEFDIVLTDLNGDGVKDIMLIPVDTDDALISVYSTDLTFMFSYELGDNHIEYYGEGDFDNDGSPELYFLTFGASPSVYMFEKTGLELIDYWDTYGGSVYNIFTITYPGIGDMLLISYTDGTLEVIYYDTVYEMIYNYHVSVGDTIESVWLAGDGTKLVAITSGWEAVTFDARHIDSSLGIVDRIDIFWPLFIDFYPDLWGMPVIYNAWFSGDVLYITGASSYYSPTGSDMEYFSTIIINVYYYPDFNAPGVITIQNTYIANNVIQFDYGASDDLWLGYIYITATYTLSDGSVKVVDVAEQPAYRFGNSYSSTLILTLPPDIVSDIVEVSINITATDLIWLYYDFFEYQSSRHSASSYAFFEIDLTPPELHVAYPVNGSSFTLSKSDYIELSIRVIENSMYPVNVLININNQHAFYVTTMGDFNIMIPATALTSGQNTITIKATDMAGNEATITIVISVTFSEPAEAAARAASTASTNSLASGVIAVFVALLALGIAVIRRS